MTRPRPHSTRLSEAQDQGRPLSVLFEVRCDTDFGEEVRVVGSHDRLGNWISLKGCRCQTDNGSFPVWRSPALLLSGDRVEYKYVRVRTDGSEKIVTWDSGPNRVVNVEEALRGAPVDGLLFLDTWGMPQFHRMVPTRVLRYDDHSETVHRAGKLFRSNSVSEMETKWRTTGGYGGRAEPHQSDGRCSAMHHITRNGGGVPKGTWPRLPERQILNSTRGKSHTQCIVTIHAAQAQSVDLTGTFTGGSAWKQRWPLFKCPESGVFWIAMQEVLGHVARGTYYFKFVALNKDWSETSLLSDSLPKSTQAPITNVLFLDFKLLERIETQANKQSLISPPSQSAGIKSTRKPTADEDDAGSRSSLGDDGCPETKGHAVKPASSGDGQQGAPLIMGDQLSLRGGGGGGMSKAMSISEDMFKLAADLEHEEEPVHEMRKNRRPVEATSWDSRVTDRLFDQSIPLLLKLPNEENRNGLKFFVGACDLPKPDSEGEDAWFASEYALGVADGVGGMQQVLGHTSRVFAEELMACICERVEQLGPNCCKEEESPSQVAKALVEESFAAAESYGASTAVSVLLDGARGRLGVTSLGDSGVIVIRRNKVHFRTSPQQHRFNWPFQLCRVPERVLKQRKGASVKFDLPADALVWDVDVREGDLILVYSDGLDDNLFDYEILELCQRALSPYAANMLHAPTKWTHPGGLAKSLALAASRRSAETHVKTPFGNQARRAGWPAEYWRGGKIDDITVVCAWVVCANSELQVDHFEAPADAQSDGEV
mmetsp:Transcript_19360/g.46606  ORF Transcript_19360/g.46606 Transcript_19360/m.46606 type:complete len:769 (+) Transcript_19360:64-2370(+)